MLSAFVYVLLRQNKQYMYAAVRTNLKESHGRATLNRAVLDFRLLGKVFR